MRAICALRQSSATMRTEWTPRNRARPTISAHICKVSGSKLHAAGQRPVDDEIRARDAAGRGARKKGHGIGDLLRRAHAAARVQRERFGVQLRIALLDLMPDAAGEVGVAG